MITVPMYGLVRQGFKHKTQFRQLHSQTACLYAKYDVSNSLIYYSCIYPKITTGVPFVCQYVITAVRAFVRQ